MATRRLVEIVLKGKDETKGAFDSLASSLGMADAKALKFAAGAAAVGAALVAGTKALYSFTSEMAALGDNIEKMNQRTGIAVETLSEFAFMLERGGGNIGDLEPAVRRLARAMGDAREGIKESVDAFAQLGITTDQLVGPGGGYVELSAILPRIADGIKSLNTQAERVDVAQALLGRGGTKLLPALQEGSEAIREMADEMERYGGAMSESFATKSAEFVDAQTNLSTAANRLKEALAEPFLAPFTAAVNKLAGAIAAAKGVVAGDLPGVEPIPEDQAWGTGSLSRRAMGGDVISSPKNRSLAIAEGDPALWPEWYRQMYLDQNMVDVPGQGDLMRGAPDSMLNYLNLDMNVDDMIGGLGDGMDDLISKTNGFSDAAITAAATFQSAMSSAFAAAIMDADNAAEAMVNIFVSAFANFAGNWLSSSLFGWLGLPTFGLGGGGGGKSVSDATKSMPGSPTLEKAGYYMATAADTYGKAYI